MTGIYEIRNIQTGQRYIGSSCNVEGRLREHRRVLTKGKHKNTRLQTAWNQGTPEDFIFRLLAILEPSEQLFIEQRWLHYVNAHKERGYNILRFTGGLTYRHGFYGTPEYGVWNTMKNRCLNPNVKNYADYGGRGITVCQGWRDFKHWYRDLGPRPPDGMLERLNNDGHYSCGRCEDCQAHGWPLNGVWALRADQAKNKRNNRWITAHGETKHLAAWARQLGCTPLTIHYRLKHGWSEEDAVTIPADMQATVSAQRSTPEWRAAQSARLKAYYDTDPTARERNSVAVKAYFADPAARERNSESLKAAWANPATRAKMISGKQAALAAKRVPHQSDLFD